MLPSRIGGDPQIAARASHYVRSQNARNRAVEIDSTMVDIICTHPLPTPGERLDRFIGWLKAQAGDRPEAGIPIESQFNLAAIIGAVDPEDLRRTLRHGMSLGLVGLGPENTIKLTAKAWEEGRVKSEVTKPQTPSPKANERDQKASEAVVRGHCPNCGADRRADVVASHAERCDDESQVVWSVETLSILKCRGCDTVYVKRDHVFSGDEIKDRDPETGEYETAPATRTSYWPAPVRRAKPNWIHKIDDAPLKILLDEIYQALNTDQRVLAAMGARTALDRAMVLVGAPEAAGFREKLQKLKRDQVISQQEEGTLLTLTDAGSAAAHRGWRPEANVLATIMDGVEAFLNRSLIIHRDVEAMRKDVPTRPKRPEK
jgi:hypothetical protein